MFSLDHSAEGCIPIGPLGLPKSRELTKFPCAFRMPISLTSSEDGDRKCLWGNEWAGLSSSNRLLRPGFYSVWRACALLLREWCSWSPPCLIGIKGWTQTKIKLVESESHGSLDLRSRGRSGSAALGRSATPGPQETTIDLRRPSWHLACQPRLSGFCGQFCFEQWRGILQQFVISEWQAIIFTTSRL